MKKLSAPAAKVFASLIEGLNKPGAGKEINNSNVYMSVHVDRLSEELYSVAQYRDEGGDRVCDPDMEFYAPAHAPGEFYPTALDQAPVGRYSRAVEFNGGKPEGVRVLLQADITGFANMWMRNIKKQQGL